MIIAATGHRPDKLGGYGADVRERLRALARDYLAMEPRVSGVISGMALGWDTAFARAAIDLGIPLVAAVPFKGQEKRWPPESQAYYRKLLDRAYHVHLVHNMTPMGARDAADMLQARNEFMADEADKIAALWNGSAGGTANCVRYAKRKGRPIDNLWCEYGA